MGNAAWMKMGAPLLAVLASSAPAQVPAAAEDSSSPDGSCQRAERFFDQSEAIRHQVAVPLVSFAARFHRDGTGRHGNAVHSPFSLAAALSLTLAGAEGETAKEIASGIGLDSVPGRPWHDLLGLGIAAMVCPGSRDTVRLDVANALFPQRGSPLRPPFLATMKDAYDTEIAPLDYAIDPEAARRHINAWVARKTRDKIPELIAPRSLSKASRLTLVNAVYLKGAWRQSFAKTATRDEDFHTPTGARRVPMMRTTGAATAFSYAKLSGFTAAASRLDDGKTSFIIVMPDKGQPLAALEQRLDGALIAKTIAALKPSLVDLTLPRFKITSSYKLIPTLQDMGIRRLFKAGQAQLAPIDGGAGQLYVSAAVQKAVIDVNEDGLEAAAATAMMATLGGAPRKPETPISVVVDRPFLFLIHDERTGMILFMGRVTDPSLT